MRDLDQQIFKRLELLEQHTANLQVVLDSVCEVVHIDSSQSPLSVDTKPGHKRCIVLRCENTNDPNVGGEFVGDLCAPCHQFITEGIGPYSQAYRNALDCAMQRLAERVRLFIGRD